MTPANFARCAATRVVGQADDALEVAVPSELERHWLDTRVRRPVEEALGALGVTGDTPLDRMYREARYARLYDGPDEVHRMVVARQLLSSEPATWPWS